eukprot:CAMPEP_0185252988 /NCGR_PEP_ID=MMETSP1359-20130426/1913_1 /TAXON_ID=552665 /ORGANISM="Bigelowiella longifila, Strain CCMP242" /LENGTH=247 /DNA_ID=CAMNT_0027835287 /DNA_START=44 /DNA_END=787 /DNA_ORIENTATION=-
MARKIVASLALNAFLALALVAYIACRSTNVHMGSAIVRTPTSTFSMPSIRAPMMGRNLRVNAGKMREAVADEYGTGLAQMAKEEKIIDKVQNDLKVWVDVFKTEPQVRDFMYDPLSNVEEKKGLVDDVVKKAGMQGYTSNFLNLLLDMGRFDQLEDIAQVFEEEVMKMQDTKAVTVRTAVDLDDDAMFKIAEKVKQISGVQNIQMKQEVDDSLLAGFVIDMEGQQIDLSLKNELDTLRQEMMRPQAA